MTRNHDLYGNDLDWDCYRRVGGWLGAHHVVAVGSPLIRERSIPGGQRRSGRLNDIFGLMQGCGQVRKHRPFASGCDVRFLCDHDAGENETCQRNNKVEHLKPRDATCVHVVPRLWSYQVAATNLKDLILGPKKTGYWGDTFFAV